MTLYNGKKNVVLKKLLIVMLILFLVFSVFSVVSCDILQSSDVNDSKGDNSDDSDNSDDTTVEIEPKDLNTDHVNTIIEQGNSTLDDVLASYENMEEKGTKEVAAVFADYAMFPHNYDSSEPFTDRMEAVYWADDNVVEAYNLEEEDLSSGENPRFGVMAAVSVASMCVSHYQDQKRNDLLREQKEQLEMNGQRLRSIESMMKTQNQMLVKQEAQIQGGFDDLANQMAAMEERLSSQLTTISMDLSDFRSEVRLQFGSVQKGIENVMTALTEVYGEVNFISENVQFVKDTLLEQQLQEPKNVIDGFYRNFEIAGSFDQTYQYADELRPVLEQNILKFLKAAVDIQAQAVDPETEADPIPDTLFADESSKMTRYRVRYTESATGDDKTYNFDFPNPKATVAVSYGNLEYLYLIMMTRFIINQTLYFDTELGDTNANAAELYLSDIRNSEYGIKTSAEEAALDMETSLDTHIEHIKNDFTDLGADSSTLVYEYRDSVNEETGYESWLTVTDSEGNPLGEGSSEEMEENVTDAYAKAYSEYIGLYLAELMSLEVDLIAYTREQ